MVILQANGQSSIEIKNINDKHYNEFKNALLFVLEDLAKKVVEDAEGATKFIEINIINAGNEIEGKKIGKKIANSILFKTAIFGRDINWGRIAAAIGSIDNYIDKDKVDICLDNILVMKAGVAVDYDEESVNNLLRNKSIKFTIDVNSGSERIKILTSDISYDYVKINAFYKKQK
jgi:glutamate N-acetyltransferase/amino-acid N-acetyltransferase